MTTTKRRTRKAREIPTTEAKLVDIDIPDTDVTMKGYKKPHPRAPQVRPYRYPKQQVEDIAIAVEESINVLLTGPTGCGKTSIIIALAAVLGRPLIRFNMNGETRVSSLIGQKRPATKDGALTLEFTKGDLAIAMQEGYWVLGDEFDAAPPPVLFVMQPVLEEDNRTLHIPDTGERIVAHPEFRFFATGNTIGYRAAMRARHAGTHMMNAALVDRFGMVISADYPERMEEIERLKVNVPECEEGFVDGICRVAEELRKDDKFRADFSTRRCIQWARLVHRYDYDVLRAAELAVVRKLESATDAKVCREVTRRIFGYGEKEEST